MSECYRLLTSGREKESDSISLNTDDCALSQMENANEMQEFPIDVDTLKIFLLCVLVFSKQKVFFFWSVFYDLVTGR